MYSKQKHSELLRILEAAYQNYFPFISTGPLEPGKPIRDFNELMEASVRLRKAQDALDGYLRQFIDKSGHLDFMLDKK